ncbi:hypothetical protein SERLA73DRAFT_187726 [Serpula lacrymans var. lacrymans S7.3]|uniref:Uncharacterized protein n=2 Tax=Serpula lacrymans var. lacrymans TaxID=341189 RepID=F8QA87_SERL3|nr:uncharacterized protein SERLADRAFT_477491 [Serpula lacrymans var. lacrymans S7.9]EGN94677.1 hypothetical protein SERLA73DRAFT_187726 [Serpula lacrymans var. lacrymans S7.3]EGO20159.1 hypothetical protein SERLADRAFT_477491 [Serpula lacrymans var. lacrymans S7.9]
MTHLGNCRASYRLRLPSHNHGAPVVRPKARPQKSKPGYELFIALSAFHGEPSSCFGAKSVMFSW